MVELQACMKGVFVFVSSGQLKMRLFDIRRGEHEPAFRGADRCGVGGMSRGVCGLEGQMKSSHVGCAFSAAPAAAASFCIAGAAAGVGVNFCFFEGTGTKSNCANCCHCCLCCCAAVLVRGGGDAGGDWEAASESSLIGVHCVSPSGRNVSVSTSNPHVSLNFLFCEDSTRSKKFSNARRSAGDGRIACEGA